MNRFYISLLFVLIANFSFAQSQTGIVRGFVFDEETGEPIIFTNVIPNTLQNYSLEANIPLNNLTITGAPGAGLNANLDLMVSPLVLCGTLTLSNSQTIFNSNNVDVSIKDHLDNSGTYKFNSIAYGTYQISVSYIGFTTIVKEIIIDEEINILNFELLEN